MHTFKGFCSILFGRVDELLDLEKYFLMWNEERRLRVDEGEEGIDSSFEKLVGRP